MILYIFIGCLISLIIIGFHCARNLTSENPLWVRLLVLAPCLSAFGTLIAIVQGAYTAFLPDIYRALASVGSYALILSVVAGKSWLRIQYRKDERNAS